VVDCVIPVAINIVPGSRENPVNLNDGAITLAVLTTKAGEYGLPLAFDATQINAPTVRFGPRTLVWANQGGASEVHGTGHLEKSLELDEVTKDKDLDMVMHFTTSQTGLDAQDTEGCVLGRLNGAPRQDFKFFGCDVIHVVPVQAAQSLTTNGDEAEQVPTAPAIPDGAVKVFLPLVTR
jgi:hypothetical protein